MRHPILTCLTVLCLTCAAVQAGMVWYSTESPDKGWSHLYSVDLASGEIADRGAIQGQRHTTDLAIDAQGNLWAVGWTNARASGASKVFQLTPGDADTRAEWSMSSVHASALSRSVVAATINDGFMYAASRDGQLQQLAYDAQRDQWTVMRSASMGVAASGGLAVSNNGQDLFVTLDGGYLGRVNIASEGFGATTVVGHSGYDALTGLAMVEGTLLATTGLQGHTSYLVQLDSLTGAAGSASPLVGEAWGLTAGAAVAPIPEPTTAAVLALGGLWLLVRSRRRMA